MKILIILFVLFIFVFLYSACIVSSRCSRVEEKEGIEKNIKL